MPKISESGGLKVTDKTREIIELVSNGISIEKAYKLVKPERELTRKVKHDISEKVAQYSVLNPKRVKKASSVIDKILNGQTLDKDGLIKPKSSDVVRIIEMIVDRNEPKVTINQNMNMNIDLSPVDLERYRAKPVDIDCE
jgi:hypothetical protein